MMYVIDWVSQPCDKPVLKGGLLYDWNMTDEGAGILCVYCIS